jgi:para-nitrobenzyl esterase
LVNNGVRSSWGSRAALSALALAAASGLAAAQVKTEGGALVGEPAAAPGVAAYKGIPYAAPPVGPLRWKAPQPAAPWKGRRKADAFGHRCPQNRIYDDMIFRDEPSEDCLYLNVWAPVKAKGAPVMVWIHGGGFVTGSASEPRQDGGKLAAKGVVVVGINYRLGVFGFFAHPELTRESGRNASGNQGLLDQVAALQWVKRNIAAFGGDPGNVTIFGESAGSFAVSAHMASPLSRGLFHRAIGESGAFFTAGDQAMAPKGLAASEQAGAQFASEQGAPTLAALRAKPAAELLKAASGPAAFRFGPNLDGALLPQAAYDVFAAGGQSHVPLLAGWNADEIRAAVTLNPNKPTVASFGEQVRQRFGAHADAVLKAYAAATDAEALESSASLLNDTFIGYATWKWIEMHEVTGGSPVYRFSFDRDIPLPPNHTVNGRPVTREETGARHAGEIEYVFGTLDSVPKVVWDPQDRALSEQMMGYWTNFARSGDPNGPGLPAWPRYGAKDGYAVLHLGDATRSAPDTLRPRYQALDAYTDTLRVKK